MPVIASKACSTVAEIAHYSYTVTEELECVRGAVPFEYEVIASIVVVELLAIEGIIRDVSGLLTQHRI